LDNLSHKSIKKNSWIYKVPQYEHDCTITFTTDNNNIIIIISAIDTIKINPRVTIEAQKAIVHVTLTSSGQPITHIKITNCVKWTDKCVTSNVTVPVFAIGKAKVRKNPQVFEIKVPLADPDAKVLSFSISKYHHDSLLTAEPYEVDIINHSSK